MSTPEHSPSLPVTPPTSAPPPRLSLMRALTSDEMLDHTIAARFTDYVFATNGDAGPPNGLASAGHRTLRARYQETLSHEEELSDSALYLPLERAVLDDMFIPRDTASSCRTLRRAIESVRSQHIAGDGEQPPTMLELADSFVSGACRMVRIHHALRARQEILDAQNREETTIADKTLGVAERSAITTETVEKTDSYYLQLGPAELRAAIVELYVTDLMDPGEIATRVGIVDKRTIRQVLCIDEEYDDK